MAKKPTVSLPTLKEHLGVNHDLDNALIEQMGRAAVDVCLAELGQAEQRGCYEPEGWQELTDPTPEWFTLAVCFLTCHYYENRSPVAIGQGVSSVEIPLTVDRILSANREMFFK